MFVRKTRGKFVELKAIGGAAHRKRLMPCTQGKGMDYRQQRSVEPEIRAYRYGKGHFCIFLHRLSFCKNAENIPRAQYCNWWKAYADFASCCLGWCLHRTIFHRGQRQGNTYWLSSGYKTYCPEHRFETCVGGKNSTNSTIIFCKSIHSKNSLPPKNKISGYGGSAPADDGKESESSAIDDVLS